MTGKCKALMLISLCLAGSVMLTACKVSGSVTSDATDSTIIPTKSSVVETTKEPMETAAVTTPTPILATLKTVVSLPMPATYASLFDGTKLYSDGSRTVILKTLVKGDQVTITGTSGQYGVTAEGSFVNLHLMSIVVTVTLTPAETTAVPTDPTAATTKATTAATTKETTASAGTTAATTAPVGTSAATTKAPVTSLSASEVELIVWSAVMDARNANGFTTNKSDILSTRCRENANRLYIGHTGNNGLESCGSIVLKADGTWACTLHGVGEVKYATLEECIYAEAKDLVTVHVPNLSTDAKYTEFGVGVAKVDAQIISNYIYVSGDSPEDLQWQIDQGWYN